MNSETEKRLLAANKALLKAYETLDPSSEDYKERLEAIAKLHKEIAADVKNESEKSSKVIDQELESKKLEEEQRANLKREELEAIEKELEAERLEEDKKEHNVHSILDIIGKGLMGFSIVTQIAMFWRSTKRENGDGNGDGKPYLDKTSSTVVQEGLRGGFWKNLPKF